MNYQRILDRVVAELKTRDDVLGIVLCGSYATGRMAPSSDLDLFVLIEGDWRQRVTRRMDGMQVEVFFNPPLYIPQYFEREARGQSLTMFAEGRVLYDPKGIAAELVREAKALYEQGPKPLSDEEIAAARFFTKDALDDVTDALSSGSPIAFLSMMQVLDSLLTHYYRLRGRWQPKTKHILSDLARHDYELEELTRKFLQEFGAQRKYLILRDIAEYVLAPVGGLSDEYASAPEKVLEAQP